MVPCNPLARLNECAGLRKYVSKPPKARHGRLHPATRSFQALRIAVNNDLGSIETLLHRAPDWLVSGGGVGAQLAEQRDEGRGFRFDLEDRQQGGSVDHHRIIAAALIVNAAKFAPNPPALRSRARKAGAPPQHPAGWQPPGHRPRRRGWRRLAGALRRLLRPSGQPPARPSRT